MKYMRLKLKKQNKIQFSFSAMHQQSEIFPIGSENRKPSEKQTGNVFKF